MFGAIAKLVSKGIPIVGTVVTVVSVIVEVAMIVKKIKKK